VNEPSPLWLISVCETEIEFVAAFRKYADKMDLFVPMATALPIGTRAVMAITLSAGQIMIEGDAEVVNDSAKTHGRSGITIRFIFLDEASQEVMDELAMMRGIATANIATNVQARPARIKEPFAQPRVNVLEQATLADPALARATCILVSNQPLPVASRSKVPSLPSVIGRGSDHAANREQTSLGIVAIEPAPKPITRIAPLPKTQPQTLQVAVVPPPPARPDSSPEAGLESSIPARMKSSGDDSNPVTGNWTIALSPQGPATLVKENKVPPYQEPITVAKSPTAAEVATPRIGNQPHAISGDVGGRVDNTQERSPVGAAPPIEVSPDLAAAPSLQQLVSKLPANAAPEFGHQQRFRSSPPRGYPPLAEQSVPGATPPDRRRVTGVTSSPPSSNIPYNAPVAGPLYAAQERALGAGISTGSLQPVHAIHAASVAASNRDSARFITDGGAGFFVDDNAQIRAQSATSSPAPPSKKWLWLIAGATVLTAIIFAVMSSSPAPQRSARNASSISAIVAAAGSDAQTVQDAAPPVLVQDARPPAPASSVIESTVAGSCTLKLSSEPSGADIVRSKKLIGKTPTSVTIPCGTATTLVFRKSKLTNVSKTFTPNTKNSSAVISFAKQLLTVKVSSEPAGATIMMGSRTMGKTPASIKLPSTSTATLTISRTGFLAETKTIQLKNRNVSVKVTLHKRKSP
jgi:hypothetical protein